ncbi:uncharacterized protein BDR25DRAFT_261751 [Lindgomyces ingoldianus]|uniref:Uncharacterized protein n=1 Tax=Lindgomyces ingoldianus TaxID=673940 RepID=A0ACB6QUI2_9PLEO|nr:uncharacterized protein BDR25DRAFT_261751 [Lindgomyces ingoldianus]KAF2470654.1 hypothetical protein BDR25DRAFT_261751 [Lindgomyces ingoldianus]
MGLSTLQPLAYAVAYVTFFFGTASIFLRFYCRIFILKTWGLDDWVGVAVLVFNTGQQAILHMFLYWGCGLHITELSQNQILQILKWLFIEEVFYYTVHFVIKMAFLFFYLRLSPNKFFRGLVYAGMGLNASIFITNILMACFQCLPFDEILHPGTHPDAVCINKLVLLIVPSILNILEDLYILILPISTVWNLQMSLRRKIAVLCVIGFGACAVIIACFRLIPLFELNSSPDTSFVLGKMVIVAALEIQFAVIAVNLPSLKALWLRITGGSSSGSGPGYSDQKGYKLSSMERKAGNGSGMGRSGRNGKSKGSRGSITRLERGITSTESEEELFRQGGTALNIPTQGSKMDANAIKVTTDVKIRSTGRQDEDVPQSTHFLGGH